MSKSPTVTLSESDRVFIRSYMEEGYRAREGPKELSNRRLELHCLFPGISRDSINFTGAHVKIDVDKALVDMEISPTPGARADFLRSVEYNH
jgi:hypothetical protein